MRPSWTVVHWGTFLQKPTLSGVYFYSGNTCFEYFKAKITCMRSFCSSWPCHTMKTSGAGQATEERAKWRLSLLGHTCHVKKKKKKQDWSQLAPSLLSGSQPTPGATSPPNSTIINTNQAFNPGIKVETQINWVSKLRKSNFTQRREPRLSLQATTFPGGPSLPRSATHPALLPGALFIFHSREHRPAPAARRGEGLWRGSAVRRRRVGPRAGRRWRHRGARRRRGRCRCVCVPVCRSLCRSRS